MVNGVRSFHIRSETYRLRLIEGPVDAPQNPPCGPAPWIEFGSRFRGACFGRAHLQEGTALRQQLHLLGQGVRGGPGS